MFERRQVHQIDAEVSQIIFQRIERDPVTLSIIASRIKQCFRDIPDRMVY